MPHNPMWLWEFLKMGFRLPVWHETGNQQQALAMLGTSKMVVGINGHPSDTCQSQSVPKTLSYSFEDHHPNLATSLGTRPGLDVGSNFVWMFDVIFGNKGRTLDAFKWHGWKLRLCRDQLRDQPGTRSSPVGFTFIACLGGFSSNAPNQRVVSFVFPWPLAKKD